MDIRALEDQLAAAQERYNQALRQRDTATDADADRAIEDVETAIEELVGAQRALAEAKGEECAVPYDIGFSPEAAVSEALLLQDEYRAFLTFSAVRETADGKRHAAGYGIVELVNCWLTKFGHPNDEALPGHRLAPKGLSPYGVYEVHNSRWIQEMIAVNRVVFPRTSDSDQKHFIFTFHDSTLECIADGLQASLSTKPYAQTLAEITKKVLNKNMG